MREYNGIAEDKIVATLILASGKDRQVKVLKGWQEIHIPNKEPGIPRFYTKQTEYVSDNEYTVYAKSHDDPGDIFRETQGGIKIDYAKDAEELYKKTSTPALVDIGAPPLSKTEDRPKINTVIAKIPDSEIHAKAFEADKAHGIKNVTYQITLF